MCFEPTARPPTPPRSGFRANSERISLNTPDGNVAAACLATTTEDGAPGAVILPDVRGLHPYYEALANEFAQAGVHALAVDLYGRTAGPHFRDEEFDYAPHRSAANDAGVRADARAAMEHLAGAGCERVFALGFCFGGRGGVLRMAGARRRGRDVSHRRGARGARPDSGARALRWGRREHHRGTSQRLRRRARGGRDRPRDGRLSRCPPQLLRQEDDRSCGRLLRLLAARARVHGSSTKLAARYQ